MTDAPTLAAWLLERIAEDEAAARAVQPLDYSTDMGGNRNDERWYVARLKFSSTDSAARSESDTEATALFARYDPARVLARCEADRRIVELHVEDERVCRVCQWDRDCDQPIYTHNDDPAWLYPCPTLRALASVYSGRAGWREEWR